MKSAFEGYPLQYIRGDFTHEEVLLKADLGQARRAVILADRVDNPPREQVDQRTLLAALAIKSLNPKIEVCAEILYQENRMHLERAHVEDIILRGEYDSALIASATESAGLFKVLQTLLSPEGPNFYALKIPAHFQGAALKPFAAHLKERNPALLIGLFTEGQRLKLEDLLSGEHSAIDEFIYRKFDEAGRPTSSGSVSGFPDQSSGRPYPLPAGSGRGHSRTTADSPRGKGFLNERTESRS